MHKVKVISGCATFGFILSFVFGLFSHSKFYFILLKALIFALVFALVGLLISIVFSKFLDDDSPSEFASSDDSGNTQKQGANLVVVDQEFERGDSENHFVVGEKHQMLNENDIEHTDDSTADKKNSDSGFVPLRNTETVNNISGTESVKAASQASSTAYADSSVVKNTDSAISEGLDTLPDMENFNFESKPLNVVTSSDDSVSSSSFGFSSEKKEAEGKGMEEQDAELMAKAISSVLSEEKDL